MEPTYFDDAAVQYDDWKGTVALDSPNRDAMLYDVFSLDPGEWNIVGIDIWGGRVGEGKLTSGVRAYIAPMKSGEKYEDFVARGEIEVREVGATHAGAALHLFEHVFKRWSIHAIPRGFHREGVRLRIMESVDDDADDGD
jgi:hypothetical protein